jgi:hypothetical protein
MKKIEFLALISTLAFVSLTAVSFAMIRCSSCYISDCSCTIPECSSGIVSVYSTSDCSGVPDYSFTFSDTSFSWQPTSAKTYWIMVLCDAETRGSCTSIKALSSTPTTKTTSQTTSKTTSTTTTSSGGGFSTTLLLILLVVLIAGAVVYFFFIKKKKPKSGYEELYSKWRR